MGARWKSDPEVQKGPRYNRVAHSPWNLPLSSGRTLTTACAAPVVAGMMLPMADRPGRQRCEVF